MINQQKHTITKQSLRSATNTKCRERVNHLLPGTESWRLVTDARDIPRAYVALADRFWLAGHGDYTISKSGQTLERCPICTAAWQTNRFDFAAPPVCVASLEARRPEPLVFCNDAGPLVTNQEIPDQTDLERQTLVDIRSDMCISDVLLTEINLARDTKTDESLQSKTSARQDDLERVTAWLRDAVANQRLFGNFELIHLCGKTVTVGEVLQNPEIWHDERFQDTLDQVFLAPTARGRSVSHG